MARSHKTENNDGHITKHSYDGTQAPGIRRSYDRNSDGTKSNDHWTDQNTGETYYAQDSGKHKAGDVTDQKGNVIRRGSDTNYNDNSWA